MPLSNEEEFWALKASNRGLTKVSSQQTSNTPDYNKNNNYNIHKDEAQEI